METTTQPSLTTRTERDIALCRSLLYQALSLGFRPPTARTCRHLGSRDSVAALAEAGAVLDAERTNGLATRTLALAAGGDPDSPETLRKAYDRLFGHTARPAVPPYETEYGDDTLFEKPQELSDLAGFHSAFGLVVGPGTHERIDHVSCELEFLAFLSRKEAHALETGDHLMLDETRRATRLFLRDHAGRFVPSFAHRVMRADDGFYGRLARLGLDFVTAECARFDVPPGPEMLRLRLPIDDRAPMACGSAGGCAPGSCGP